jgi:hypothetical protein
MQQLRLFFFSLSLLSLTNCSKNDAGSLDYPATVKFASVRVAKKALFTGFNNNSWREIPANSGYMAEYTDEIISSIYSGSLASDTYIEKLKFISKEKVIFTSNDPQGNSSDFEQDLKYLNDNDFYADIIFQKDSSLWSNRLNSGEVVQYINFINIKDHIPDFKCPEFLDLNSEVKRISDNENLTLSDSLALWQLEVVYK